MGLVDFSLGALEFGALTHVSVIELLRIGFRLQLLSQCSAGADTMFVAYVQAGLCLAAQWSTVTFVAQIQFRPDISTAVPDSRKCEVSKSQEFHDNHEYITLKR